MASRILSFVSCALYFFFLINFTIIGLASFIIGIVGIGRFIPTHITYTTHKNTTCFIVDVDYDICQDSCYCVMWSIEYHISNCHKYTFSTIIHIYETLDEALKKITIYNIRTNHTCYYDKTQHVNIRWEEPSSSKPYLTMMIVGFSLTGIYIIIIVVVSFYRARRTIT